MRVFTTVAWLTFLLFVSAHGETSQDKESGRDEALSSANRSNLPSTRAPDHQLGNATVPAKEYSKELIKWRKIRKKRSFNPFNNGLVKFVTRGGKMFLLPFKIVADHVQYNVEEFFGMGGSSEEADKIPKEDRIKKTFMLRATLFEVIF